MKTKQLFALTILAGFTASAYAAEPIIGLITKTETNPFFVKMQEGASKAEINVRRRKN